MPWQPEADGNLWSSVLELRLAVRDGGYLQAQTAGQWLLTPSQSEAARLDAEAEIERLRGELDRFNG